MFEIQENIPKPQKHGNLIYPFREMRVGDSFFVPFSHHQPEPGQVQSNLHNAAAYQLGARGLISTRQVEEGGVRGFRVWLNKSPEGATQ